ncbi:acyltransferase [Frankia sp. Cr1]|uniref:acyltransferase family protein n=1 Tax=Frankia sp. Cr1 TaxID=3073931 RepID=UPI002AD45778|nr:acyltransferase [Frankia sp. Cr1]
MPSSAGSHKAVTARLPGKETGEDNRNELVDLSGFRGLAVMIVMIFHAYQFCRGGGVTPYDGQLLGKIIGASDGMVSWFFLISGFLLYMPIVNWVKTGQGRRSPREIMIRRGLRILPLYYTALLVVWATRNPGLPGDWRDLVEHLTFTHVFDSKRIFYTIGPAWSLAVEVFFYVYLAGVAAWLARKKHRRLPSAHRWRLLCIPAVVLVAVSAGWAWYAVRVARALPDQWAYWFSPQNHAKDFGFGMVLAILYLWRFRHRPISARSAVVLRLFAAAIVVLGSMVRGHSGASLEAYYFLNSTGFALLLAGSVLGPRTSLWRRFFAVRVFVFLGVISYSVYLWHEPILLLVLDRYGLVSHAPAAFPWVAVVLVVSGILGGMISYVVLERPARRLSILLEKLRHGPEPAPLGPPTAMPVPLAEGASGRGRCANRTR